MLFDPPPPYIVSFRVVVSGSVESFDKAAFAANLAETLGVDESTIALDVSAASVNVLAQYGVTDFSDAQSAYNTLSQFFSNETMKEHLACALGLCGQILSVSALETIMSQSTPEPGDDDAVGGEHGSGSGSGAYPPAGSPPAPLLPPAPPPKDEGLSLWGAVGLVLGILALLAMIGIAWFYCRADQKTINAAANAEGGAKAAATPTPAASSAAYNLLSGTHHVGSSRVQPGMPRFAPTRGRGSYAAVSVAQPGGSVARNGKSGRDFVVSLR